MTLRHRLGNVLRNLAQRIDPQPPAMSWTYHVGTGTTSITYRRTDGL